MVKSYRNEQEIFILERWTLMAEYFFNVWEEILVV
jgi:hypothetical protein